MDIKVAMPEHAWIAHIKQSPAEGNKTPKAVRAMRATLPKALLVDTWHKCLRVDHVYTNATTQT